MLVLVRVFIPKEKDKNVLGQAVTIIFIFKCWHAGCNGSNAVREQNIVYDNWCTVASGVGVSHSGALACRRLVSQKLHSTHTATSGYIRVLGRNQTPC